MEKKLRLGELLIEAGVLTQAQLDNALEIQKARKLKLGTILIQERIVPESQLIQALSRQLSIPWVSLTYIDASENLLRLVPCNVAEEFFLFPVYTRIDKSGESSLYVAMNDPTDESALRFVRASSGMNVKPMLAGPSEISAAIRLYYYGEEEAIESQPAPATIPVQKAVDTSPPPPIPVKALSSNSPGPVMDAARNTPTIAIVEAGKQPQKEAETSTAPETDLLPRGDEAQDEQNLQREIEKHMFGVGGDKPKKGFSITLMDGTVIKFGDAMAQPSETEEFSTKDLLAGLRAAASGSPMDDFLPSVKWEAYMAALLEVLFKKKLLFFEEFMEQLNKKS